MDLSEIDVVILMKINGREHASCLVSLHMSFSDNLNNFSIVSESMTDSLSVGKCQLVINSKDTSK